MANTRTKFGESGDPERDFAGTFPGSSPFPSDSFTAPGDLPSALNADHITPARSSIQKRQNTTKDQWRLDSHTPLVVPEYVPPTDSSREAARVALAFLTDKPSDQTSGPRPGTLLDASGRAVLGSRAMTPQQVKDFIRTHPDSSIKGIDKELPSPPVAE
ncbi:MAG: hypothetical protein QG649_487 [Patescibacteria group bacterium]|nr:hypothetical protein [Patescibacteria group bacterium]